MAASGGTPRPRAGMALCALWLAVLWTPMLQMAFRFVPEIRLEEKRKRAGWPTLPSTVSSEGLKRYLAGVDRFVTDHFGFRDRLIDLHNRLHVFVLRTSPRADVVIGKDSWLFYNSRPPDQNIVDFCGLATLSPEHLVRIRKNLRLAHDRLAALGVDFYVVVPPSKHTIYPEMLPDDVAVLAGETRLDQITGYLRRHDPELAFIDVRPALSEAKARDIVYCPGDTHWSPKGVFIGFRELMQRIVADHPEVLPVLSEDYVWSPRAATADLAAMVGVPQEPFSIELPAASERRQPVVRPRPVPEGYPALRSTVWETESPGGRLLLFHDSFGLGLIPLIYGRFSRSVCLWTRSIDEGIVAKERPDVVVLEITERYLVSLVADDFFKTAP